MHIGKDRKLRSAKQHEHYRWRGELLKDLILYEYVAMIDVRKRPKSERPIRPGRQPNPTFDFNNKHPLAESHIQVLRSKFYQVLHTVKNIFDMYTSTK